MNDAQHVLITEGAGYIGSYLTGELLRLGMQVTVVDELLFERNLHFDAKLTVDDGVREVLHALRLGLIRNPQDQRYRNAQFIVQ